MSDLLLAPECECGSRQTRARINPHEDMVAVRCENCDETLVTADIMGADFTGVKDPNADPIMIGGFH
jgi:hypothetical protein